MTWAGKPTTACGQRPLGLAGCPRLGWPSLGLGAAMAPPPPIRFGGRSRRVPAV